jgi:hypothetical protein
MAVAMQGLTSTDDAEIARCLLYNKRSAYATGFMHESFSANDATKFTRPWFACPHCRARVAVIYMRRGGFYCRRCSQVAYYSQSEDAIGRGWRVQQQAESKLGKGWARPKGMHQATHERLLSIIWECEERREAALSRFVEGMLDRYPSLRDDPMMRGLY